MTQVDSSSGVGTGSFFLDTGLVQLNLPIQCQTGQCVQSIIIPNATDPAVFYASGGGTRWTHVAVGLVATFTGLAFLLGLIAIILGRRHTEARKKPKSITLPSSHIIKRGSQSMTGTTAAAAIAASSIPLSHLKKDDVIQRNYYEDGMEPELQKSTPRAAGDIEKGTAITTGQQSDQASIQTDPSTTDEPGTVVYDIPNNITSSANSNELQPLSANEQLTPAAIEDYALADKLQRVNSLGKTNFIPLTLQSQENRALRHHIASIDGDIMSPPTVPGVGLIFENLSVSIPQTKHSFQKQKRRIILNNVSAVIRPGRLVAIVRSTIF